MSDRKDNIKICIAASGGGHISQLLKLAEAWKGHKTFCVTTTDVIRNKLGDCESVYVVGESNRQHPFKVLKVIFKCMYKVARERPRVVISTGAAAGCIVCFLGKMTGAKVVWIDSIANVTKISLSGRMVRHIADLFITQWPHFAEKYKNVEYVGTII